MKIWSKPKLIDLTLSNTMDSNKNLNVPGDAACYNVNGSGPSKGNGKDIMCTGRVKNHKSCFYRGPHANYTGVDAVCNAPLTFPPS